LCAGETAEACLPAGTGTRPNWDSQLHFAYLCMLSLN